MESSLQWFVNDGGPLLVLPCEALPFWGGEPADDYERACEVDEWAEAITVGPGLGLVLGGDHTNAAWVPLGDGGTHLLARVIYADDDSAAKLAALYEGLPEGEWVRHAFTLECAQGGLTLLHAASAGAEVEEKSETMDEPAAIGDAVTLRAGPGRYAVETCEVVLPDEGHYIFHRFRRT